MGRAHLTLKTVLREKQTQTDDIKLEMKFKSLMCEFCECATYSSSVLSEVEYTHGYTCGHTRGYTHGYNHASLALGIQLALQ